MADYDHNLSNLRTLKGSWIIKISVGFEFIFKLWEGFQMKKKGKKLKKRLRRKNREKLQRKKVQPREGK